MPEELRQKIRIRVVGVGNAGVKIVGLLASTGCEFADLAAIDTDELSLADCLIENAVCIGKSVTAGAGSGSDAAVAKEAAIADLGLLKAVASGAEVFIFVAGLGGGTGSVVTPILCKLAAESGAKLVVSFSLMPLSVEGSDKSSLAERSVRYMRTVCDAAATLPNDIILARSNLPIKAAFETANTHVASAVKEICAMLAKRGIVNIDLPSFKKVFFKKGEHTFFGIGSGSGANASEKALSELAASPLIEFGNSASCAESLMVSLVCGEDFEMNKMQALLENVAGTFGVSERICFGAIIDKSMNGGVKICAMGLYDASRALPKKSEAPVKQISVALNSASAPAPAGEDRRSKINPLEEGSCQAHGSSDENRPGAPIPAEPLPEDNHADVQYAPAKPAQPAEIHHENKPKKSRGFFGFGRRKPEPKEREPKIEQSEFKFMEMSEQRGFFEDTPVNIRKGEDLDVPTFMRRNIKINL